MKSFSFVHVFVAVTLGASVAVAYPALNDKVTFNGRFEAAVGGIVDFTQTLELIAFDASKNEFTLRNIQVLNGSSNVLDQQIAAGELASETAVKDLLSQCLANGGTPERLTVSAGLFETCKLPQSNGGQVWIADVPFGFVKLITIDSEGTMTAEMASFEAGK